MRLIKTVAKVIAILVGITILILTVPLWLYFPGHNWRTVEKDAFYGCRQMSGPSLERMVKNRGIRTVLNMRGHNPGSPWYDEEVAASQMLGVKLENFSWSKNSLPDPESLQRFIEVIETGPKPFLAHCQGGTHRTGVAAACYVLLKGGSPAEARKQFGPMFKDAPIGKLVDLYEGSNMPFKQWVREVYPGQYAAQKESPPATSRVKGSRPRSLLANPV